MVGHVEGNPIDPEHNVKVHLVPERCHHHVVVLPANDALDVVQCMVWLVDHVRGVQQAGCHIVKAPIALPFLLYQL